MFKQFYITVFKFLSWFFLKFLSGHNSYSIIYTYALFNAFVVFYIINSSLDGSFILKSLIYVLLFSLFLYFLDKKGLGFLLYQLYRKWLYEFGVDLKNKAYKNLIFVYKYFSIKEVRELFKNEMRRYNVQIKKYPNLREVISIKEDISIINNYLKYLKNDEDLKISGTFFFARRPHTFLTEQELPISAALSITLFLSFTLTYMWQIELLEAHHILLQVAIMISIVYTLAFFSVTNIYIRKTSLGYDQIFYELFPELDQMFDLYKNSSMISSKIEINKQFFKYYFVFYFYKTIIASVYSSIYFLLVSVLFLVFEFIFFGSFPIVSVSLFWFKYYLILLIVFLFSFLWYSSFVFASSIKVVIVNFIFSMVLFFIVIYMFSGDVSKVTSYLEYNITFLSVVSLAMSFIVISTRKMFFNKENYILWVLE